MDSITHILDSINSFSSLNFIFSSFFEPLKLPDIWTGSILILISLLILLSKMKLKNSTILLKTMIFLMLISGLIVLLFLNKSRDFKQISFDDILASSHVSPVRRRADKPFNFEGSCPFCGAPKDYIYDNNAKGQLLCKACRNTFSVKTTVSDDIGIFCPYCSYSLEKHHDRKGYIVYKCPNYKCSYYLKNKKDPSKTSSNQDYLHFTITTESSNLTLIL